MKTTIKDFDQIMICINKKYGVEIGGPSKLFEQNNIIPIYSLVSGLDGINYAEKTIWDNSKSSKHNSYDFFTSKPSGKLYICDGADLSILPDHTYDFLLASHVIEHIANPIKALYEWKRIVKDEGYFVFIIPHRDGTFDHRRPITHLQHMIDDYNNHICEDDTAHFEEVLKLHDFKKDPLAGDTQAFRDRTEKNHKLRGVHHHVFNTHSALQLINYCNYKIVYVQCLLPYHIVILSQNIESKYNVQNTKFLSHLSHYLATSPFSSDRNIKATFNN